ncbi:hypothetical protein ACFSJU_12060 [Paradesertivirga mongoliensis]|uniref:PAS domain-containing protein n=1 Tax=Paradesertivirga mongoliensis TaxID=2100740 RepID=A0ABW4ZMG9_9SPHI|nr:hypothetical protein [Pedobacter mongoliensis]
MQKFPIYNYSRYSDLPLDEFDSKNFAIYVVNKDWTYLFANQYVFDVHNLERNDIIGNNIWETLNEKMQIDSQFRTFIQNVKKGIPSHVVTVSAISNKRVSVVGYALLDAYYFAVTILPDKDELLNELRREIKNS